jgi:hypothetical protein
MNELSVTEEETIRGLLQLRWSHRRIAREAGHHRATIQRVTRAMAIVAATEEPKPATDSKVATDHEAATDAPTSDAQVARDPFAAGADSSDEGSEIQATGSRWP